MSADSVFGMANTLLVVSLVLGVVSTFAIVQSGKIRDALLTQKLAEANKAAGDANKLAAEANKESEMLKQSNVTLGLQLEQERIKRLELEKRVEPRHLSDEQIALLVSKLRSSGWKKAEIIWVGDGEPEFYARDLGSAFEQAGMVAHVHTLNPFIPSAWGLAVVKSENYDSSRLKAILDEAGVDAKSAETNDVLGQKDHPTIVVGYRQDTGVPK
jgi:hypothetical protein